MIKSGSLIVLIIVYAALVHSAIIQPGTGKDIFSDEASLKTDDIDKNLVRVREEIPANNVIVLTETETK